MEKLENEIKKDEEEISLIDLFAVLLRYRKMIILGTVIITFISSIFVVILPKIRDMKKIDKLNVTYSVKINRMPGSFKGRVFEGSEVSGVGEYLSSNIRYLPFFAEEYKKYPFFAEDGKLPENQTVEQYNQMVSEFFDEKKSENSKIKIKSSVIVDTYDLNFEITPDNKELANTFVKEVVQKVDSNLIEIIMPRIDVVKEDIEKLLESLKSSFATMNDAGAYQNLERSLQDIEKFKKDFSMNPHFAMLKSEEPFSYTVKKFSKAKSLSIAMFASFFIMIFVAFARNAVVNIKNDSESSKIIKDAWKAGK